MDGAVLVALMGLLVLGVLGIVALTKKGRIQWDSHTDNSVTKVEIDGETPPQRKR